MTKIVIVVTRRLRLIRVSHQTHLMQLKKAISWKEVQTFTDSSLVDQDVELMTSTRDSSKSVCIFFDKFTILKHNILQQVRHCKSKCCKMSLAACVCRVVRP